MNKNQPIEELTFCLKLWETQRYCEFGGKTKCEDCGAPYVLWKMISGEVLHGSEVKRLSLQGWKKKFEDQKD